MLQNNGCTGAHKLPCYDTRCFYKVWTNWLITIKYKAYFFRRLENAIHTCSNQCVNKNILCFCLLMVHIITNQNRCITMYLPMANMHLTAVNKYKLRCKRHFIENVITYVGDNTVYPKKYAHGFCFAVLCCGYTLTDFPISIRLTSLALWQSNDCPSASKATLINMDKYFMWIHYERLHNHNKAKHNKTVCIFLGIYCTSNVIEKHASEPSIEHIDHIKIC